MGTDEHGKPEEGPPSLSSGEKRAHEKGDDKQEIGPSRWDIQNSKDGSSAMNTARRRRGETPGTTSCAC